MGVSKSFIAPGDFLALQQIALELSAKYPSDWLERFWRGPNMWADWILCMVAIAIMFSQLPPLAMLVPAVIAQGIRILPKLFWNRLPNAPRWAHPKAILTEQQQVAVDDVVTRLTPVQRARLDMLLPVSTGDKFWLVLTAAAHRFHSNLT
jgi:hypothetical protein